MWLSILEFHFSIRDCFAHRAENFNTRGDFTDFTSVRWLDQKERPFLITQTKANRYRNQNAVWARGEQQLRRCLQEIAEGVKREWFWGVLAIGVLVRIYRYNKHSDALLPMGYRHMERLDVNANARAISNMLIEINRRCQ